MRRGSKPARSKEAKPPVSRKSPKNEGSKVRDLEQRLAAALKREAEAQRRESEALDQQTATAEILKVISSSPTDVQPVFDAIARSATTLCEADLSGVYPFDGERIHFGAWHCRTPEEIDAARQAFPQPPSRLSVTARAILAGAAVQVADVSEDPEVAESLRMYRTVLAVPMMRDERPAGAITVARRVVRPFSDSQIELLRTFADQAVIAIENVRLFKELQEKNQALTQAHVQVSEALEQQTATADILRVISSSPTDVQPVFDELSGHAARLCGANDAVIFRLDGEVLRIASSFSGEVPLSREAREWGVPLSRGTVIGRAVIERRAINVPDLLTELDTEYPQSRVFQNATGMRSVLAVPLVREEVAAGAILVRRLEVRPFTSTHIALLQTFADQAVIAIENVRLFKELQARNLELTTALDRQTATSEILQTIAQAQTDVQPVFDTIVRSAAQLCRAHTTAVFLTDGSMVHHPASYGDVPEALAAIKTQFPRPLDRETAAGTAILTRSVIHLPDVEESSALEFARQTGRAIGFRSLLSVPMLRQGEAVGAIHVTRREPGPFSDAEVALLQTFADQAVIAIENVRLFRQLEVANRDLSAASQHKSEFLANMSHELRTPLNAIIGFSEVLSEKMFGELNEKQEEYSKDIHASGQHLLSLINDILDLSKIEAGRMELELSEFHLPTALDSALTLVRERAGRRGIALHLSVDERLGQIQADDRKVRQVVLNLLSNAIKFTQEGGRIEVAAVAKDGLVEVSVSDTGVGIAPEDQEAVFEEFRQVGTADKKVEGTGLGLTLCRKFVELHGGKIWVKSELGAGSTFTFTVPVRQGE